MELPKKYPQQRIEILRALGKDSLSNKELLNVVPDSLTRHLEKVTSNMAMTGHIENVSNTGTALYKVTALGRYVLRNESQIVITPLGPPREYRPRSPAGTGANYKKQQAQAAAVASEPEIDL